MTIETRLVVFYVVWIVVVPPIALLVFSYEPNALYVVVPLILAAANCSLRIFLICPKCGMRVTDTLVKLGPFELEMPTMGVGGTCSRCGEILP